MRPIALTMGEPASIAPEITMLAWLAVLEMRAPRFFVIGDPDLYAGMGIKVAVIAHPSETFDTDAALPVLPERLQRPNTIGAPIMDNAGAVIRSIERATALALAGEISAIVTNPISKAALYAIGFAYQGHTDFLGALTAHAPYPEPRGPAMMLAAGDLRVSLVTEHLSLQTASQALSVANIIKTASITASALQRDFGVDHPRLAIAALNPHAGENGALGREEIDIIAPASAQLRASGLSVSGPLAADTLFHAEARETWDAVICMYHDQGLIPVKMLDFWGGVNITLGLPIVRTSPDHGTGFDIAGKGVARPDSLIAALRMAINIAQRRQAS